MRHRLKHLFRLQLGKVVSVTVHGRVWIAFQCDTCGDISDMSEPLGSLWTESKYRN